MLFKLCRRHHRTSTAKHKSTSVNAKKDIETSLKSQIDIYTTILQLLGKNALNKTQGESLLTSAQRALPVLVESPGSHNVFIPSPWKAGEGLLLPRSTILQTDIENLKSKLPSNKEEQKYYLTALAFYQVSDYFRFHKPN